MASRVQYPSNAKVYQLNKANLAGVGQNGKEPPGCLVILKTSKRYQRAPSPFHRPTSSQRIFSATAATSCANNLLCPCAVCETHSNPAVSFSVGRATIVVFTENHQAGFAQEEKEDMASLIHIHLQ